MVENNKYALGAAFAGIFIGVAGLVFGVVAKNRTDQLQAELAQINELFAKIQRIEESSDGVSASTLRLSRELDAMKAGTQDVLHRVNQEIVRMRQDLNAGIGRIQSLESSPPVSQDRPPATPSSRESGTAGRVAAESTPRAETGTEELVYLVKQGDTLTKIASDHRVSLDSLLEANPNVNPNRMQIGQRIRIPAP